MGGGDGVGGVERGVIADIGGMIADIDVKRSASKRNPLRAAQAGGGRLEKTFISERRDADDIKILERLLPVGGDNTFTRSAMHILRNYCTPQTR